MTPATMADPIEARTLPHSLDAERAVLGAVILHNSALDDIGQLRPDDFYRDAHRRVYRHMQQMATKRREIDLVTLKESLLKAGELDEIGGASYLAALTDGVPHSTNVEHYARIVREKAELRSVIFAATQILRDAYAGEDEPRSVIDRAEQMMLAISERQDVGGLRRISEFLPAAMEQIEAWHRVKGGVTGMASGLVDLDRLTRGFQAGNLVVVAARPGIGKSSLVLNMAHHVAGTEKVVAFFSLEMSLMELLIRSVSMESGINSHRLQGGYIREAEWARLSQAFEVLSKRNLYIDDSSFVTLFDIRSRSRRLKARERLDLIVIDYTQLMGGHERNQNRALEIAGITRGFKAMAKDLQVPVIALSQLNRDITKQGKRRPLLSDLRESGAIEQDADMVVFIHREEDEEGHETEKGVAELIVAKHRGGPIGTVKVGWRGEQTRFFDLDDRHVPEDRRLPMVDQA